MPGYVVISGAPGAGKTTLAGPVFEVDTTSDVDVEALAARIAGAS